MTWYASQIMTTGDPSVIAAIKQDPVFTGHTFRVMNPIRHIWHNAEVAHSVPSEGIIFIRPICDPNDHITEWYDNDILSWECFDDGDTFEVSLSPTVVASMLPLVELVALPPLHVLRATKSLSVVSRTPVAFYYCFCWGGDVEIEYAWLFGDSERVLIRQTQNSAPAISRLFDIDIDSVVEQDGDVLVRTLHFLSCEMPTPFFAPHTRGFLWEDHRFW